MKIIKYFFEFISIISLFCIFKIIGLKKASNLGSILGKIIGPFFRSKDIIKQNIKIEDQIYNKNKNAKIFYSKYKPIDINRFKDKQIYAFSGIGNPSNFFDLLKENNLNLIGANSFPDHYHFTKSDLEILIKKINSEKNQILLTTEKDYFRFPEDSLINKLSIQYLKIELEIENKDNFIELIKKNI